MSWNWPRFEEEGKELFNYLTNNYDELFNNDGAIKHFTIRDDRDGYDEIIEEIIKEYEIDIEKELRLWIKNEKDNKRLFDNILWKPFRNMYNITNMYFGYKILFQYKQYYFQLIMENICNTHSNTFDDCIHCPLNIVKHIPSFTLILYGWKDNTSEKLQPYVEFIIPSNNIMPNKHWNIR